MSIPDNELEDAILAIQKHDLDDSVFIFDEVTSSKMSPGYFPKIATVTVTNTMTGQTKEYDAGAGTSWVVDFKRDLATGEFSGR